MKDPAFLFYPGDWLQGTMGMTMEEQGAYLNLLILQFNKGKFTEAHAKLVLNTSSASVLHNVLQKFSTDGTYFWKQRLTDEITRRKKFSESRRNNAKGRKNKEKEKNSGKAYAEHMETETETITETINNDLLKEYDDWTNQIIDGNDHLFEQLFMQETIPAGDHIQHWIMDHRDLLNRYPKMRPPNQAAFRKSCIKHIRENYKKPINGTTKQTNKSNQHRQTLVEALKRRHNGSSSEGNG